MVLSGGNHGKKSQVTPPGIDPGTVRQVAQCLNHYATRGPLPGVLCNTFWCSVLHSFSRKAVFSNRRNKCSVSHNAHRFIQWKFVFVTKLSTSQKMSSPQFCPCIGIPDVLHVYQHLSYNPLIKFANSAVLLFSLSSPYVVHNYKIIDSYIILNLLEVLIVFLAKCFGSYTEPSSG
jgi:hypothetical protein